MEKISNYIKKNKFSEKALKPEYKRYYSQNKTTNDKKNNQNILSNIQIILNLLLKLTQYSDMIGTYSKQEKENYLNIINIIFKEIKKFQKYFQNQNNNHNNNFNIIKKEKIIIEKYEKEIQNYKIKINNLKNYISDLKKLKSFSANNRNNIINSEDTNKFNLTDNNIDNCSENNKLLKQEINKERYNSAKKDKKIKELKEQNTALFKKYKEYENEIISKIMKYYVFQKKKNYIN